MKQYFVYILSSHTKTLYIGVTNDLVRRIWEHREGLVDGFTKKYDVKRLVYYEVTNEIEVAISREKQLKNWRREKKEILIRRMNPAWEDLYDTLLDSSTRPASRDSLGMTSL